MGPSEGAIRLRYQQFRVGEEVEAEFVQELAIAVEPAPTKPQPGFKNKRGS